MALKTKVVPVDLVTTASIVSYTAYTVPANTLARLCYLNAFEATQLNVSYTNFGFTAGACAGSPTSAGIVDVDFGWVNQTITPLAAFSGCSSAADTTAFTFNAITPAVSTFSFSNGSRSAVENNGTTSVFINETFTIPPATNFNNFFRFLTLTQTYGCNCTIGTKISTLNKKYMQIDGGNSTNRSRLDGYFCNTGALCVTPLLILQNFNNNSNSGVFYSNSFSRTAGVAFDEINVSVLSQDTIYLCATDRIGYSHNFVPGFTGCVTFGYGRDSFGGFCMLNASCIRTGSFTFNNVKTPPLLILEETL